MGLKERDEPIGRCVGGTRIGEHVGEAGGPDWLVRGAACRGMGPWRMRVWSDWPEFLGSMKGVGLEVRLPRGSLVEPRPEWGLLCLGLWGAALWLLEDWANAPRMLGGPN